jgi:hypothetical protein
LLIIGNSFSNKHLERWLQDPSDCSDFPQHQPVNLDNSLVPSLEPQTLQIHATDRCLVVNDPVQYAEATIDAFATPALDQAQVASQNPQEDWVYRDPYFGYSAGANRQNARNEPVAPAPSRNRPLKAVRAILEDSFKMEVYPDKTETDTIAQRTKMTFKQVRQWFRNKRRRTKPEGM